MAAPDELDPVFLADLVGYLYEAAANPQLWSDFVGAIEQLYPDSRITLFGHENGRPTDSMTVMRNFPEEALRDYINYYVQNSPYIESAARVPVGRPTMSEEMVLESDLLKSEHYFDFVRPHRLGYFSTGLVLERGPGRMTAFSIADSKDDETRRGKQMRLLKAIGPHFCRAIRLRRTLLEQEAVAGASQAAFDRWTHPSFVLTAMGRVLVMNSAAQELLKEDAGIFLSREGLIRSFDETQTRELEYAIAKCAAAVTAVDGGDIGEAGDVVLPCSRGGSSMYTVMWPLPSSVAISDFDAPHGRVLMMVFDPQSTRRVPVRWIARQFGLSPSEEKLTEAIVNGFTLTEAADRLGIRVSTAQTRLKVIQTKTGCRRQVDLVRLAMSLPTMRQD